ncbi:metal ABC transporter substrate-binding protein [uncultured Tolumonas sp.]|uniref:metal ABC transporter substrate-binding protein n=1 Tax=uncultured Tolumonas sp. TaxID=263765 RepID=UPI002A0A7859|nr:metal ABC transporter substrate-binding protein [uncultured Tolumonas sp.]
MKLSGIAISLLIISPVAFSKDLDVVTSFSVLSDMVKQIGGEHVNVTSLIGPNGDPHVFEPTPKDAQRINHADVVIVSGLGLEGWIERLIKVSGFQGQEVVASAGINTRSMVDDGQTITDPHAWNSMKNAEIYANNIMNALIKNDPDDAEYFLAHGKEYMTRLERLDAWAKNEFSKQPVNKRKILTSHDAFGYFGAEYGVKFLSPVGFSTESEASAKKVSDLINQLKSEHIKTYFFENQTDLRLVKQIAAETGAQPGGELYPEALSKEDGPAPTFEAAFKHNVEIMLESMKK